MNAVTPTAISPEPAARSHWAERRLALLDGAMECTSQLIHSATRRAGAAEGAERAVIDLIRCLRQTALLQARLEAGLLRPLRAAAPPPEGRATDRSPPGSRKPRIRRALEDSIRNEASGERAEELLSDLRERLEDPELESELADKPIGEVLASICQDLGIAFDASLWTEEEPESSPPDDPPPADPLAPLAIEPQLPRCHSGRQYRLQGNWQWPPTPPDTDPAPD